MRVAAIDCGTNSTRLLVADERGATLQREMRITRLGQGVDASGALAPAALARTYGVLDEYAAVMRALGVERARLIATSAARDAANGAEFLAEAHRRTGAEVALLSGTEEAELSYRGATMDLPEGEGVAVIVDIGGGSTELAARVGERFASFSMQLGCVRVTERALGPGVVTAAGAAAATAMIAAELGRALTATPALATLAGRARLIGLAGTVATLAQLDARQSVYDRAAVHHRTLSRDDVVRWRDALGAETPEVRLRHPGMVPGREDVLVGGLYILAAVMDRLGCDSLLSSENDILDGLVAVLLES